MFAPELAAPDHGQVREWYNGYNWLGAEKVYNPYDVLLLRRGRLGRPSLMASLAGWCAPVNGALCIKGAATAPWRFGPPEPSGFAHIHELIATIGLERVGALRARHLT